jgi:hypothetical protein
MLPPTTTDRGGGLLPLFRHSRGGLLRHSKPRTSNFLPPFPRSGFASRPFHRSLRHQYYEGCDSCRSHPDRQVSPLTPPCRPGIPTSTTQAARRSLSPSPQRRRLLPGFATHEQARHRLTPNQVRHPTDCRFTSGCSPPRLPATQLPSMTEPATGSGTDLHRADKASSRTHSCPRKRHPMRRNWAELGNWGQGELGSESISSPNRL